MCVCVWCVCECQCVCVWFVVCVIKKFLIGQVDARLLNCVTD